MGGPRAFRCLARLVGLVVLAAASVPIATSAAPTPAPVRSASPEQTVAAGDNALGFSLLRALFARAGQTNVVISPMSIGIALSMTANGAGGQTLAQMQRALGTAGMPPPAFNAANRGLTRDLKKADPAVAFEIGNSLWGRNGVTFAPPFVERVRAAYDADAETLDFASPSAPARINGLVYKQTHGMIGDLVDRIEPSTFLILVNTLYFKGKWSQAFDPHATRDGEFTTAAGAKVKVPMMSRTGDFSYAETDEYQAIALPYGKGRLRMLVMLPTRGGSASALASKLSWQAWNNMRTLLRAPQFGAVELPRFATKVRLELTRQLRTAGLQDAFDARSADFSAMVPGGAVDGERAYIGEVQHVAVVKVDEEGTEASAATSVGMRATAIRLPSFSVTVDRPFLFAIEDDATGALLFLGVINDPA